MRTRACDSCLFASPGKRHLYPSDPEFFCECVCRVPEQVWKKSCRWRAETMDEATGDLKSDAADCPAYKAAT
jgi:hypothetical protein